MNSVLKYVLFIGLAAGVLAAGPLEGRMSPVPESFNVLRANDLDMMWRNPAPVWDSNRVWIGATSNLTRDVALGQYFKGAADDTIRMVSVQSGGTRYLVIATDTMASAFAKNGFRVETPYTFASGSTPYSVAVGDVDGDPFMDILAGQSATPYRLFWFEWDTTAVNWAVRDSITVNNAINDIVIGDADNNGTANEILFNIAATAPNSQIMRAVWNGASFDTMRIYFTGTVAVRGVAIGDVHPDLSGNEVYVCGGTRMWMAHYNGASWDTTSITTGISGSYDVLVGDIDPTLAGNEVGMVHGSTSYQVSVFNWTGSAWAGRLWALTSTWGTSANKISIGDVLAGNPGNELVVTGGASTTAVPRVFWIAPNGSAWMSSLPKSVASQSDYGVAIGNVNRFRTLNDEIVLSGGGSLVEVEQLALENDVGTYYARAVNGTAVNILPDTLVLAIFNSGSNPQTGFTVGYAFQSHTISYSTVYAGVLPAGGIDSVRMPVPAPAFTGMDTVLLYVALGGDMLPANDTTKLHLDVFDDSTVAASTFNGSAFPPANATTSPVAATPNTWWRTIVSGSYNWNRYTAGTNPTCTPLEGNAMAGYPCYNASSGQQARLRTHRFNIGANPRKVMLRFYMYGDPGYQTNPDSVIVEYSYDDTTYMPVAAFHRYNAVAGWYVHDVEIGDFPATRDVYVAFRARSGYGNNIFIDSVRVFTTTATAPSIDAGVMAIDPFPAPIIQNDPQTVTAVVRNYGLSVLTTTPVFYTDGGADTVWGNWTGSLYIGQTDDYVFATQYAPGIQGEDTLWAGTRLSGDQDPANDVARSVFTVCPEAHVPPYIKDFEEAWSNSTNPPFCGWMIVDGGSQTPNVVDNNDWHRYVLSNPSRNLARIYYSPIETSDDWLISPRFDCTAYGQYTLNYWHFYNDFTAGNVDSGQVLLSQDDGVTWQIVHNYSDVDDSGYKSVDVTSLVQGQNDVKFAFRYIANNEFYWYIDDFNLDFAPDSIGPAITLVEQPQDTYEPGPYIVRAVVTDPSGIASNRCYYLVDDIWAYVDAAGAVGDTFAYEIPTQTAGTMVEYFVYAVDAASNVAQSGQYQFWVLSPLAPTDLNASWLPDTTVELTWMPPYEELSYCGDIYYYWGSWNPGDMVATQFTPQHLPARVEAAAIQYYVTGGTVLFQVWNDDGNGSPDSVLYSDTLIVDSLYPAMEIVDLSGADIVVNGDFHVGYTYLNADAPWLLSDSGSNTTRSKYNQGTGWYASGCDWIMSAAVSYLPGAKAVALAPKPRRARIDREPPVVHMTRHVVSVESAKRPGLLEQLFGISGYTVGRSEASGGPYTPLGSSTMHSWVDSLLASETVYYYAVRADYTSPDTVSYYSNEVNVSVDLTPPLYASTAYDSTLAGPWIVSTDITDWTGIAYDTMAYRTDSGAWTMVGSDSFSTATYFYTIPDFAAGTRIEFYLCCADSSYWQNLAYDPSTGYYAFTSQTGVAEGTALVPKRAFVSFAPNPFSKDGVISYGVPTRQAVTIKVFNAIGQQVSVLVDQTVDPGYYTAAWSSRDANDRVLPHGIYFIRMTAADKTLTTKLVRLK